MMHKPEYRVCIPPKSQCSVSVLILGFVPLGHLCPTISPEPAVGSRMITHLKHIQGGGALCLD